MKKTLPYLLSLFLTFVCFLIHMSENTNSMLNDNNNIVSDYLTIAVEYHKENPVFKKRPITTFLIEKTSITTGISIGEAFIFINFLFLFLSGVLIYYLSKFFTKNNVLSLANIVVYFTCFSNLFAFFSPIYTYDEPIQFCLILLSLISLYKERWLLFILTFSLSLIARESGLILYPALFLIVINKDGSFNYKEYLNKKILLKFLYLITPILIYFIFLKIYLTQNNIVDVSKTDLMNRLSGYAYNTQNQKYALESLVSMFLVIGLPLYLLYNSVNKNKQTLGIKQKYIRAFFVTVLINTVVVLLTTQAKEARLFVLPLFFIWPIFTVLFLEDIKLLVLPKNYILIFRKWKYVAFYIFLNILNYIFSFKVYECTALSHEESYFNEYLFIYLFIIITHFILKHSLNSLPKKHLNYIEK